VQQCRHIAIDHWQDANDQGASAGANAAGVPSHRRGGTWVWSTIGEVTVKYHACDGYEHDRLKDAGAGFAVWYESNGAAVVGVLTHECVTTTMTMAKTLIAEGRPAPTGK